MLLKIDNEQNETVVYTDHFKVITWDGKHGLTVYTVLLTKECVIDCPNICCEDEAVIAAEEIIKQERK